MKTCDLRVIGFKEGKRDNIGKLGSLIVDYKGYEVGVGSGLSAYYREEIWNNKDEYIGRIIEVRYFEESNNEKGGKSLRFPSFRCFRDDKDEESYN